MFDYFYNTKSLSIYLRAYFEALLLIYVFRIRLFSNQNPFVSKYQLYVRVVLNNFSLLTFNFSLKKYPNSLFFFTQSLLNSIYLNSPPLPSPYHILYCKSILFLLKHRNKLELKFTLQLVTSFPGHPWDSMVSRDWFKSLPAGTKIND